MSVSTKQGASCRRAHNKELTAIIVHPPFRHSHPQHPAAAAVHSCGQRPVRHCSPLHPGRGLNCQKEETVRLAEATLPRCFAALLPLSKQQAKKAKALTFDLCHDVLARLHSLCIWRPGDFQGHREKPVSIHIKVLPHPDCSTAPLSSDLPAPVTPPTTLQCHTKKISQLLAIAM